jgi:diacylglycerol O-acyltransferase
MADFMRSTDAFTWSMENDPRLRSTVVTLMLLDRTPDWDEVRSRFDLISRKLPMFRQRVAHSPLSAPPRWEPAPDFDLEFHMRRVSAAEPATVDVVLEMARLAAMEDFDRARPLWKVTLIDGLADGGTALLCTFHHALTDGVGGVQIGMTLFDLSETSSPRDALPAAPEAAEPSWLQAYADTMRYNAGMAGRTLTSAMKSAPSLLYNGIRHPAATIGAVAATLSAIFT